MSGMDKTTLARVVFDRICDKFDASSFLEDVREASKDTGGLAKLQDQILRDMKLKFMVVYERISKSLAMDYVKNGSYCC